MTARIPTVLIILDGWGYREEVESNAIRAANTPTWDRLWRTAPTSLLSASGEDVGLPSGQMGNSEVGHICLGAGRVVYQNISRIDRAITSGEFFSNSSYCAVLDKAIEAGRPVHLLGLVSPGGIHSHENHILAMIKLAKSRGATKIYVHAFLDGRDTPPRSAEASLQLIENALVGVGQIASIIGRFYAMDRDNRWDRTSTAYALLTEGVAKYQAETPIKALQQAYARGENDEFVQATVIAAADIGAIPIQDGDAVIFMNFRADRARQLTRAFTDPNFNRFVRNKRPQLAGFVTTTGYAADIDAPCAFPPEQYHNGFGEYLASLGKTQLRIAETEKYAHVTFFFNGGQEDRFPGEDRILIPSPRVKTYDLQPEMSAWQVTEELIRAIESQKYDTIICNYANGDMVGHTGIFEAAIIAVETVDRCLEQVVGALQQVGGQALITSDHGNIEQMSDPVSGQAHTAHTCEPVPLIYVGSRTVHFRNFGGRLSDIAPTLLELMDLKIPAEMTGSSLLDHR